MTSLDDLEAVSFATPETQAFLTLPQAQQMAILLELYKGLARDTTRIAKAVVNTMGALNMRLTAVEVTSSETLLLTRAIAAKLGV